MVLSTNLSTPKGRRKKTSNCGHVRQRGPRLKFFLQKDAECSETFKKSVWKLF